MSEQPQNNGNPYDANSAAVQAHLSILQGVINRMAANSASCKNWCVVLVAAILVLVARADSTAYAPLALLPTFLFFFLDAYYLAQEKDFISSYQAFVKKLHSGALGLSDLYDVRPSRQGFQKFTATLRAASSFSVWWMYLVLAVVIGLVWKLDCVKSLLGL